MGSELKGRQVQPSREQQYHLLPDYQYPTPRGRQWHQFDCQERKKKEKNRRIIQFLWYWKFPTACEITSVVEKC